MAKSNNNNKITNRSEAFVSTAGPNQHRSTIPLTSKAAMRQADMAINQAYYEGNMSANPNQRHYALPGGPSGQLGKVLGTAYKGLHMLNDSEILGPRITQVQVKQVAKDALGKVATATIKSFKSQPNYDNMKSGNASSPMGAYGLSKAPTPRPVSLNSGIKPNTFANDYMNSVTGLCSPMHMSAVTLRVPTDPADALSSYFTNTLCFDIQSRAQSNINFDLDITTKLSFTIMQEAFNAAIEALQIYFYYTSIMSYESDARNKNEAMISLRQGITSSMISELVQLGRRLEDTPIPPRIVEWVRYMSMNYLSGDTQGAPLIKLTFKPAVMTTYAQEIGASLTRITNADNTKAYTLLRRAIPQWRVGKLYDVPTTPVYDKNFLSIFANLCSSYYNGTVTAYSNAVTTSQDVISYNSYTNRLDGVAYAMCCVRNTNSNSFSPGICVPNNTNTYSSRQSFYSTGGAAPVWTNSVGNAFLTASRAESYSFATLVAAPTTVHLPGAEKCQQVTAASIQQTARNVLDFLFNIDSIPRVGKLSGFNRSGNGSI